MTHMADNGTAHFTYIWAIENASKQRLAKSFRSPVFTMDSDMQATKWHLTLDLGRNYLTVFIRRAPDDDGPDVIDIDYEISLLSADKKTLVNMMDSKQFKNSSNYALRRLATSDEVFNVRRNEFLPKDTLTVQCRIWKKDFGFPEVDLHYARTQIFMDRISFVWSIKNFSNLKQKEKRVHLIHSTSKSVPQIILTFYLIEECGKELAFIHIDTAADSKCHPISGRVCLLDVNGGVYQSIQIEESVNGIDESNRLGKRSFPKNQIIDNKESLLPNDVLTFRCEFEISMEPFCCQIEQYKDFNSSTLECMMAGVPEIQFFGDDIPEACGTVSSLQKFLAEDFGQGTLSDVCLRAGSKSYPVHRVILSAYSPVFKALFTKTEQNKTGESIDINDVDPVTLRLLLLYIYTNAVPNFQWQSAIDLFKAADKYELADLRDICSDFLKSNLDVTNCCSALVIADRHHDQKLRTAVYGFMIQHQTEIFKSDMWMTFKSEYFTLATHTLEHIISMMKTTENC